MIITPNTLKIERIYPRSYRVCATGIREIINFPENYEITVTVNFDAVVSAISQEVERDSRVGCGSVTAAGNQILRDRFGEFTAASYC